MIAFEITVMGRVQGVFFRKYTCTKAIELNLLGYVKNQTDGSVFIYAEGEESKMNSFMQWCKIGSPLSKVEKIITKEVALRNEQDFRILPT
ncbi:MAG: acylphosphatase [Bacteroidia bacterium]|nr:acylphosphatase [Bacteroidia bacterium]MCF8426050.1 acylphosphatase [Bacteroidia bacterium]MCF8445355.1 acylphosphatase [Bacteroidia bacterium]